MKVSAQEEYGLRCMLQLARRQKSGSVQPLSLTEMARSEGLTVAYVAKLVRRLRRSGLVLSVLGRSGGYTLSRSADEVALAEILAALGGKLYDPNYCSKYPGDQANCAHLTDCSIRSVWGVIETILDNVLSRTTLGDLVGSEQQVCMTLDGRAPAPIPITRECR
jgi:Rrf2 family protein